MAAVDYFLKIDGIEGESHDSKHKGEVDLESWSWGESQSGKQSGGGGGGAGKVVMQDFHFVMKSNKASPKLMLACATGQHIAKVVLTIQRLGLVAITAAFFVLYVMGNAVITLDTTRWFFSDSVLQLLIPAGLAVYGFYVSRGGEPIFGGKLLD